MSFEVETTAAIHATIAGEILAKLDTADREVLLQQSIANVIGGYDFQQAVSKVVAKKAAEVVAGMVATPEWEQSITKAVNNGFHDYLTELRSAVPIMLKEVLHGKDGSAGYYSTKVAEILRYWPQKPTEDKTPE